MTNQSILVEVRDQYGAQTIRPVCPTAQLFARIAGTKTLTRDTIQAVKALGYRVEVKQQPVTI